MMLFSRFSMDETELRFENLGAGEVVMAYHKALTPYKIPIGAYNKDISVTRKESATSHSCLPLLGRSDYAPISAGAVIIARTFPPPKERPWHRRPDPRWKDPKASNSTEKARITPAAVA